jgi:hypothetical protein
VLQDTDTATAVTACLHARNWADVVSNVPDGLSVRLDRRRLDVIVANLVGNAVRHGEAPVTVRVSAGPGGPAWLSGKMPGWMVQMPAASAGGPGQMCGRDVSRAYRKSHTPPQQSCVFSGGMDHSASTVSLLIRKGS